MSLRWTDAQYDDFLAKQQKIDKLQGKGADTIPPEPQAGKGGSKYHSEKVVIDGITFHSKKEGARYQQLKMMEHAGKISDLRLQVPFVLAPTALIKGKKKPPLRYYADFCYFESDKLVETVEDCKGFRDAVYKIKRHLMSSVHGIDILET